MEVPASPVVHWIGAGGLAVGAVAIGALTVKSRREDVHEAEPEPGETAVAASARHH